jgi:hypothetical protein
VGNIALRSVSGLPPRGYCREGHPIQPHTMLGSMRELDRISLSHDQSEMLERQAVEIFTIQANAGLPFAKCLAGILLSGIDWGHKAGAASE